MKICRRFFTFLALFGLGALPVETSAQLTKVTTSYVSDSAGVLPLWLAKEAGIFARNGLDVQAVRVHAAVGVMALMSGELQFVLASGPVWLTARCAVPMPSTLPEACQRSILWSSPGPRSKPPSNSKAARSACRHSEALIQPQPVLLYRSLDLGQKTCR